MDQWSTNFISRRNGREDECGDEDKMLLVFTAEKIAGRNFGCRGTDLRCTACSIPRSVTSRNSGLWIGSVFSPKDEDWGVGDWNAVMTAQRR
jgi:hypothetical protein